LQHLVTAAVAELIIDDLEVVEVDEQHRRDIAAAGQRALDDADELGSVGQPGQPVVGGLVEQPSFGAAMRAHRSERQQTQRTACRTDLVERPPHGTEPAVGAIMGHDAEVG
jgi:hypothetical protein